MLQIVLLKLLTKAFTLEQHQPLTSTTTQIPLSQLKSTFSVSIRSNNVVVCCHQLGSSPPPFELHVFNPTPTAMSAERTPPS